MFITHKSQKEPRRSNKYWLLFKRFTVNWLKNNPASFEPGAVAATSSRVE